MASSLYPFPSIASPSLPPPLCSPLPPTLCSPCLMPSSPHFYMKPTMCTQTAHCQGVKDIEKERIWRGCSEREASWTALELVKYQVTGHCLSSQIREVGITALLGNWYGLASFLPPLPPSFHHMDFCGHEYVLHHTQVSCTNTHAHTHTPCVPHSW